jgi:predicted ATPase
MDQIRQLLGETQLLTLTGAGGTGKTRLAIESAGDVLAEYPDGLWLVELASVADPANVPDGLAAVLGLRPIDARPMTQVLRDFIGARRGRRRGGLLSASGAPNPATMPDAWVTPGKCEAVRERHW